MALKELDWWLEVENSHPQLWCKIIKGLQQWHDETPRQRTETLGSMAGQA